jgi:hypothetical protein
VIGVEGIIAQLVEMEINNDIDDSSSSNQGIGTIGVDLTKRGILIMEFIL